MGIHLKGQSERADHSTADSYRREKAPRKRRLEVTRIQFLGGSRKLLGCWRFDKKQKRKYYVSLEGYKMYGSEAHEQAKLDKLNLEETGKTPPIQSNQRVQLCVLLFSSELLAMTSFDTR